MGGRAGGVEDDAANIRLALEAMALRPNTLQIRHFAPDFQGFI
jgi:hypothetical protein